MPAFRIVEALDVVEYISSRLVSGAVRFASYALGLQRREEALHRGIVPDVARTAHRTDDAVIGHQLLELLAGVLAATVGMMHQRIGFAPSPDRHHRGIADELRRHRSPHRPADNAAG